MYFLLKNILLSVCYILCFYNCFGQREILPLPLDKLNRDSLNKVIIQKERKDDNQALGDMYGGMFTFFYLSQFRDSAIIYALKAEEHFYKAGDSAKYYFTQLHLGELSESAFDIALGYWQKAVNYYRRTNNYKLLAHALNDISRLYSRKNDSVNSLKYYHMSVEANRKGKDTFLAVIHNTTQINRFMKAGDLAEAIQLLFKNIDLVNNTRSLGNSEEQRIFWKGILLNSLGECYYRLKDYSSTIKYLKEAEAYDQTADYSDHNLLRYRFLAESYIHLGVKDSAIKYVELFYDNADKIVFNYDPAKLNELTHKYENEKKQRQIEQLENKTRIQQLIVTSHRKWNMTFIIMFTVLLLSAVVVIRTILQKRKLALELAHKEVLYKEELHKQEQIQIRNKISRDLHDDVGATLSSVKAYSEIIKENPDNLLIAELINENATDMIEKLEMIAWTVNPKNDSFKNLSNMINRYAAPLCQAKNIAYKFSADGVSGELTVPGEIRQTLYLISKEAINNTVKYSGAANCCIDAWMEAGKFIIKVSDDGDGFEKTTNESGNGLNNMQARLEEIGGEIIVDGNTGTGTQIKVQLPYPFKIPEIGDRHNKSL